MTCSERISRSTFAASAVLPLARARSMRRWSARRRRTSLEALDRAAERVALPVDALLRPTVFHHDAGCRAAPPRAASRRGRLRARPRPPSHEGQTAQDQSSFHRFPPVLDKRRRGLTRGSVRCRRPSGAERPQDYQPPRQKGRGRRRRTLQPRKLCQVPVARALRAERDAPPGIRD